jgi:hypothetical protein
METIRSSETSVLTRATQCDIPGNGILRIQVRYQSDASNCLLLRTLGRPSHSFTGCYLSRLYQCQWEHERDSAPAHSCPALRDVLSSTYRD